MDSETIFEEYLYGKQTYAQLSERYSCSIKTIQRHIDKAKVRRKDTFSPVANVVMDTTYFGRKFGVMVFKNTLNGAILLTKYVKTETVREYVDAFRDIPVQTCQFHQVKTITFYLTKKPKLPAAIALRALSLRLVGSLQTGFAKELDIPNTTNSLDGLFSDLKNKLRNHNGLSEERKKS